MIAAGNGGSIINISSIAGALALGRGNLAHSANKGAINQMTKELAVEWAKYGIRVNAILPCQVLTEGFQEWIDSPTFDPAMMESFLRGIPMNRLAKPEDMAGPAIFLASDAAAMVTGTSARRRWRQSRPQRGRQPHLADAVDRHYPAKRGKFRSR